MIEPEVQALFDDYFSRHARPVSAASDDSARARAREILKAENYPFLDEPLDPAELKKAYARGSWPEPEEPLDG